MAPAPQPHPACYDHGFNNVSTYGNLLRLIREERIPPNEWEISFDELALKVSRRCAGSPLYTGGRRRGIHLFFNGPHSLFVETPSAAAASSWSATSFGHVLQGENDVRISLLETRALQHMKTTATYNIWYGEGRDIYDEKRPHGA